MRVGDGRRKMLCRGELVLGGTLLQRKKEGIRGGKHMGNILFLTGPVDLMHKYVPLRLTLPVVMVAGNGQPP